MGILVAPCDAYQETKQAPRQSCQCRLRLPHLCVRVARAKILRQAEQAQREEKVEHREEDIHPRVGRKHLRKAATFDATTEGGQVGGGGGSYSKELDRVEALFRKELKKAVAE